MNSQFQTSNSLMIKNHWGWFFTWGIALLILGIAAISVATFTTLFSVMFLGAVLFIGGALLVIDAFKSWWGRWNGFFSHFIMGILYLIAGAMFFSNPVLGSISLTLLLGIFYIVIGAFRIISSLGLYARHWSWSFFNGIISLLLGLLIVANWPAGSLFIIGLFVGIDLALCGWTYMMIALAAKNATP